MTTFLVPPFIEEGRDGCKKTPMFVWILRNTSSLPTRTYGTERHTVWMFLRFNNFVSSGRRHRLSRRPWTHRLSTPKWELRRFSSTDYSETPDLSSFGVTWTIPGFPWVGTKSGVGDRLSSPAVSYPRYPKKTWTWCC